MKPFTEITAETYARRGSEFIAQAGKGFAISLYASRKAGQDLPATPKQWGAWLAYFRSKGIPYAWMARQRVVTVPAEWPHQFDADATAEGDKEAAEDFYREHAAREEARKRRAKGNDLFETAGAADAKTMAARFRDEAGKDDLGFKL
ncbi:MAG: hypothetical protein E6Q97_18660 [Desulfurellales bacterium]|nr:MAG: hypothetical protein E6Q97_18660 [Desulfurellales bacterium]